MDAQTAVDRLTGVYDAEGTLRGELAYWVGKRLGRRHCALCDITHGSVREKPEWRACSEGVPVPFDLVHRDERTAELIAATDDVAPVVVAHTGSGIEVLLGPDDLEACGGEPPCLVEAVEAAVRRAGLAWSRADPDTSGR